MSDQPALRVLKLIFILVPCLWLCLGHILSCTKAPPPKPDVFAIALDTPPRNLHPQYAFDLNSQLVDELLFDSLIQLDANHIPTCTSLCDHFSFTTPTQLEFVLSQALVEGERKFADGSPITVKDVVASLNFVKHHQSPFKGAFQIIQTVSFHPPNVLRLTLNTPKPSLLVDLVLAKILKHNQAVFPLVFPKHLVSSGPFVLEKVEASEIDLRPNPHWVHKPTPKPIKLVFVRDDQTRVFKFIRNEVQAIFNAVPYHAIADLKQKYNATVTTTPGINITYLGLNHTHPLLKDPTIRRLIRKSLNLKDILTHKFQGFANAHFSILPIGSPFITANEASPPTSPVEEMSPDTKKQLLGRIAHQTLYLKSSNSPSSLSVVKALSSQLKRMGFRLVLRPLEFGAFMEDLKSGNFDLYYASFVGITDPSAFYDFLHSKFIPPHGRNRCRFRSGAWDVLSQQLAVETGFENRVTLAQQLQELFSKELPMIPLWVKHNMVVLNKKYKIDKVSARPSLRDFISVHGTSVR